MLFTSDSQRTDKNEPIFCLLAFGLADIRSPSSQPLFIFIGLPVSHEARRGTGCGVRHRAKPPAAVVVVAMAAVVVVMVVRGGGGVVVVVVVVAWWCPGGIHSSTARAWQARYCPYYLLHAIGNDLLFGHAGSSRGPPAGLG
jgi:hypothetical protein